MKNITETTENGSRYRGNVKLPVSVRAKSKLAMAVMAIVAMAVMSMTSSARAGDVNWVQTNALPSGNWSVGANWVGAVPPGSSDSAFFASTNTGSFGVTNDITANDILDLTYDYVSGTAQPGTAGTVTTLIKLGTKLSVLGPNGFFITREAPGVKVASIHKFAGDTLVVSNVAARFVLNSGQGNTVNTAATIDFSTLSNLYVKVGYFGAANAKLSGGAGAGDQVIKITLARTNIIFAANKDDFTQGDFTNSIELCRMDNNGNNQDAQNSFFKLGISNLFLADSIGIGRSYSSCASGLSLSGLNVFAPNVNQGFQVLFNTFGLVSSAVFRNTNGTDRVSLLALCVDSGTNLVVSGNRLGGVLNLQGGKVDMLVDKVWLARNYTNSITTNGKRAGFIFDNGNVDANTVIAGYMQYTNTGFCQGYLVVGSNAVMHVNDTLILGYTPIGSTNVNDAFASAENNTGGQVQVNNGGGTNGTLYVNKIEVGLTSTNNQVVVNGSLVVSNGIASSAKALDVLNEAATGKITFSVTPGVTNAFVNTLIASGGFIKIASAPAISTNYVLIHYTDSGSHSFNIDNSLPAGINSASILDDNAGNIYLQLSTVPAKKLVWRGAQDNNWNHSSTNWYNPAGLTNCAFTDGDTVQFDDAVVPSTTINVTEAIYPGQIGFGIAMTNSINNYVFTSSGGGSILQATLNKAGTGSLQLDATTTLNVFVTAGDLKGSGVATSVTVSSGAAMNFAGTVNKITTTGSATVASGGIANGKVSVLTGGSLTNLGTMNGNLSMSTGSTVVNTGVMNNIGTMSITTNSVLINGGTIYDGSTDTTHNIVTVDLGGTLIDTVVGASGFAAGSLNVGQLAVNGTFMPGNGSVSTTKVTDFEASSGNQLNPYGRVNLNTGSTTILAVNMDLAPGQTNTVLLSQNQGFGGSLGSKSFSGGTLVITNKGTVPFAAGQSFKMFAQYITGGDCQNAGNNTTNTYPVIQPATPGAGLVWELDQLIPQGIVRVLSATDPSRFYSITNTGYAFKDNGTNKVVIDLTWPADKDGGWIQTLTTGLTNGLTATNWANLTQSLLTGMPPHEYIVTNTVTGPGATFYRYVYP